MSEVHTVAVKFRGGYNMSSSYVYKTDLKLKKGDVVVVDSPSQGYAIVDVTSVHDGVEDKKATKWIVCKVDDSEYKSRKATEQRRIQIENELRKIETKINTERKYDYLAGLDPKAAELLSELRGL